MESLGEDTNKGTEAIEEIVEKVVIPETPVETNAFEEVMGKQKRKPKRMKTDGEPIYKSRVLLGVFGVVGGILIGKYVAEPKVVTKIVEKEKPVVDKLVTPLKDSKSLFRNLKTAKEFDPWKPLNGGFPIPPAEEQQMYADAARNEALGRPTDTMVARMPRPMRGDAGSGDIGAVPLDPSGALPDIIGEPLPSNGKGRKGETLPDTQGEKPVTKPTNVTGGPHYLAISLGGGEPGRVASVARNNGGEAREFSHVTEEGAVEAQGVLLVIPAAKYDKAKSDILKMGGSVDGEYEGSPSSHQGQIQGIFVSRLAKLRSKKKDLLIDFQEDAPPVLALTEAIDIESRAVSATRVSGGSKIAVIRVLIR
jgi:hypothetical protein